MVTKAQLRKLDQAVRDRTAALADRPDTSTLGELVSRNEWSKLFRGEADDGRPVVSLVTRTGSVVRIFGMGCACFVSGGSCDHCPQEPPPVAVASQEPPPVAVAVAPQPQPVADEPAPPSEAASRQAARTPYNRPVDGLPDDTPEALRDVIRARRGY